MGMLHRDTGSAYQGAKNKPESGSNTAIAYHSIKSSLSGDLF